MCSEDRMAGPLTQEQVETLAGKYVTISEKDGRKQVSRDGLVNYIAKRNGMPVQMAREYYDTVMDALTELILSGVRVRLRGFGWFSLEWRKGSVVQYSEPDRRLDDYLCFKFQPAKSFNTYARAHVDRTMVPV